MGYLRSLDDVSPMNYAQKILRKSSLLPFFVASGCKPIPHSSPSSLPPVVIWRPLAINVIKFARVQERVMKFSKKSRNLTHFVSLRLIVRCLWCVRLCVRLAYLRKIFRETNGGNLGEGTKRHLGEGTKKHWGEGTERWRVWSEFHCWYFWVPLLELAIKRWTTESINYCQCLI